MGQKALALDFMNNVRQHAVCQRERSDRRCVHVLKAKKGHVKVPSPSQPEKQSYEMGNPLNGEWAQ